MKRLVVVESPTKARTIRGFLPQGFQVEASMGHVRDLPAKAAQVPKAYKDKPWSNLGVDVENGFQPLYIVPPDKKKVVSQLKKALKDADELYIATDEDREGESIGWHLLEVLKPKVPVRRMVFHEITREAIQQALDETRDIDNDLVDAQETRRILDRLVGYSISPLLWRKIAPRLSAGRVQSVAVRLLVMREKERIHFVPAEYWDLTAQLTHQRSGFKAEMTHLRGARLASGRDFEDETGRLSEGITGVTFEDDFDEAEGDKLRVLLDEKAAMGLAERLKTAPWRVANVEQRTRSSSPYPPFITSTLQQEASRKLGFGAGRTMRAAQKLYENGHITYMRTDSPNLSGEAVKAARRAVGARYGDDFLSPKPRQYRAKAKNAQEAHEAIRPAGTAMKTADELRLSGDEYRVYDLIWKRTVATQMADAKQRFTTVTLEAGEGRDRSSFRASGKEILFPGFFRAYVEGSDDPDAALEDRERPLPNMQEGDNPDCEDVEGVGHETKAPSRYTEASLIKVLESEGIGRPSTYASIIDTIKRRGYVDQNGRQLAPTFTAFATNNLLEVQFEQLVDTGFTAEMETILDDIARGQKEARPFLHGFYAADDGLEDRVDEGMDKLDARAISTLEFKPWEPYVVRVGKYGPYVEGEVKGETTTASLPEDLLPGDAKPELFQKLLEEKATEDKVLGIHPDADMPILLKTGPYGPYVQLGEDEQVGKPKRQSLPKGTPMESVDFQLGLDLINLPRTLGEHPESGEPITAAIGRYGPYVKHKRTYASLKKGDDVLTVELPRALELLAEKEKRNKPQRELGEHPETGEPIGVWEGRYGPYVKHKRINATLPKGMGIDEVTLEQAVLLIQEKESKKGGRKRKSSKKKSSSKKTTGKKKSTSKKRSTAKSK